MGRFVCHDCGQEWEKHPATVVPCPDCRAPSGSQCRRPSGHATFGGIPHVEREQRAVDEGLLEMCPKGPTARARRGEGRGEGRSEAA